MPRIPISDGGGIAQSSSPGIADISGIYEKGTASLAKGLDSMANAVAVIAKKQNDIRDDRDAANASVDIARVNEDLMRKYENDSDFNTWQERYNQDYTKARNTFIEKYGSNPRLAEKLTAMFDKSEIAYRSSLTKTMHKREAAVSIKNSEPLVNQHTAAMSIFNSNEEREAYLESNEVKDLLSKSLGPYVTADKLAEIKVDMLKNSKFMNIEDRLKRGTEKINAVQLEGMITDLDPNQQRFLKRMHETEGKSARVVNAANAIWDASGGDPKKVEQGIRNEDPEIQKEVRSYLNSIESDKNNARTQGYVNFMGKWFTDLDPLIKAKDTAGIEAHMLRIPMELRAQYFPFTRNLIQSIQKGEEKAVVPGLYAQALKSIYEPVMVTQPDGTKKPVQLADPEQVEVFFPGLTNEEKHTVVNAIVSMGKASAKTLAFTGADRAQANAVLKDMGIKQGTKKHDRYMSILAQHKTSTGDGEYETFRKIVMNESSEYVVEGLFNDADSRAEVPIGKPFMPDDSASQETLSLLLPLVNKARKLSKEDEYPDGHPGLMRMYHDLERTTKVNGNLVPGFEGPVGLEDFRDALATMTVHERNSPSAWRTLIHRVKGLRGIK